MSRAALGIGLALLATPALAAPPARIPEPMAVSGVLDAFHAAAARADGKAYFDLFTPDAVFIGTDAAERWGVEAFRAYAEPMFAKGQGWTYRPRSRHVVIADIPCGCIAWFDELLDSDSYGTTRGTGVLRKTRAGWKIAQYAMTFPIPNALAKDMTGQIRAYEAKAKN
ncbi:nuclear transport factor 2 family protein [Phenylobacterium soli]|uniref:Protein with SnoaL 3 domain, NTF 2 superfamily n=1 Tax=Phenylobacterium soli TaxID=2170551 RepID=A0A328AKM1_9CAUL|nr:nuclear transport factor 2 family protein [Phenylobacterium soli]RAK55503.1 protein with SnoaL 3 domain, NTF 2 superfamily [Phenylobacterium soli]